MEWLTKILNFIVEQLLSEFVIVVVGILFVHLIQNRWLKWKYGNWSVIVFQNQEQKVNRGISPAKVKEILSEPSEKAVFLKGVASPYDWINCDIIELGPELGLLKEDTQKRQFIINLDKNPPKVKTAGTTG